MAEPLTQVEADTNAVRAQKDADTLAVEAPLEHVGIPCWHCRRRLLQVLVGRLLQKLWECSRAILVYSAWVW